MNYTLMIAIPIVIICIIGIIVILVWWIRHNNHKLKENIEYQKKDKEFYKDFKPVQFKDWEECQSGIVLSAGIGTNIIKNNFVLKNLKSNSIKKIEMEKLSVAVSNKRSAIVIAPPGTGKTQSLLLPTILYNIYCKDKPNMIITDPKPEIQQELNNHFIKQGYNLINISLKELKDNQDNYLSDFINPFENIINYHKLLLETNDSFLMEKYISMINIEINNIIDTICYKENATNDYWNLNGKTLIKYTLSYLLALVEIDKLNHKYINPINLITYINNTSTDDLKSIINNEKLKKTKSFRIISSFLAWIHERDENVASFKTNALIYLDFFNQHYISLLTSKTTIDLDSIIQSNKPFAIFITLNLVSANEFEKNLIEVYLSMIYNLINKYKDSSKEFRSKDVYWFIDEAGNINRINFLGQIISFGRGMHMYAVPIFQNENQINNLYGNDGLLDSCEYKILFANTNEKMAKKLSDLEGTYEIDNRKHENLELSKATNIPEGYVGIWKIAKKKTDKMFYIVPVIFFYMIKQYKQKIFYKNKNYLVSDYVKFIKLDNDKSNDPNLEIFDFLNINPNVFGPNKNNTIYQFGLWLKDELLYYYFNNNIQTPNLENLEKKYTKFKTNENINFEWLDKFLFNATKEINILYKDERLKKYYEKN